VILYREIERYFLFANCKTCRKAGRSILRMPCLNTCVNSVFTKDRLRHVRVNRINSPFAIPATGVFNFGIIAKGIRDYVLIAQAIRTAV
jgi:hypothetical protein